MTRNTQTAIGVVIGMLMIHSGTAWAQAQPNRAGNRSAACNGTEVCVCVGAACEAQVPRRALPPAPPAPPPPPVAPAPPVVYQQGMAAPAATVVKHKKAPKKLHVRLGLALDFLPLNLDLRLSDHWALNTSFMLVVVGSGHDKGFYGGIMGGLDYYFKGRALDGLRLGARVGVVGVGAWGQWHDVFRFVIARAVIGYNWTFDDIFSVGLEGGLQYMRVGDHEDHINLVIPHAQLSFGFVF